MPPIMTETKKGERKDGGVTAPQDHDHFKRHFKGTGGQVEEGWMVAVHLQMGRPEVSFPLWQGSEPA